MNYGLIILTDFPQKGLEKQKSSQLKFRKPRLFKTRFCAKPSRGLLFDDTLATGLSAVHYYSVVCSYWFLCLRKWCVREWAFVVKERLTYYVVRGWIKTRFSRIVAFVG